MGKAGRKLRRAGCVSVSVSGGEVVSDQDQMNDGTGHTQHSLQREEENSRGRGPGATSQKRQAVACSQSEGGGRCCTGSRNLELAVLSSWAGCLGRVAALLRHDRAERAAIEWHRRRRKWWGLEARRARSVVGGKRWCNCDGRRVASSHAHVTQGETGEQ